jgi:hypothetical protein
MPESALAPPFVTMVTYRSTFKIVFSTSDGKGRYGAIECNVSWYIDFWGSKKEDHNDIRSLKNERLIVKINV